MTTKQRADLLAKLGYGGNNSNPYEIIEWLNKRESFDVVCLPTPNYKWKYVEVSLGEARKDDRKLNAFYGKSEYSGKRRCLFAAIDHLIGIIWDAKLKVAAMSKEERDKRLELARQKGLL